jgi:HK97 family phage major capsid protein/HK97 family phage prohead protease
MTIKAFAVFDVKSFDEEQGVLRGIASTPSTDRVEDIVDPKGAVFKLPLPLLWQHSHNDPIGHVTEASVTDEGIEVVATVAKGVTPEIDRAWTLIKAGLVRGFSIGFRGLEVEEIPRSWGVRYKKWEWLELSAVTIPANADATITNVKHFATAQHAATGTKAVKEKSAGDTAKSHKPVLLNQKSKGDILNIAEKATAEGRTTDASEQEDFDTISAEIDSIDADLKRFRALEKAQVGGAKPVNANGIKSLSDAAAARSGVQVKAPKLEAGIGFARLAKVKGLSKITGESPRDLAKSLYGEESAVYGIIVKAAVSAGSTQDGNWAANLVGDETSVFADFVEFLRPQTILGKFGTGTIPSLRRVPFRTPLIGQTSGGDGYWVGEGKAKPLTNFGYERNTLEPTKVANIAVVTEELLRSSSPSAEILIRDSLAAALRARLDTDFINPAKAAVVGVSPASITNGITPIVSTGTDADAVRNDLRLLFSAFIAANNAPTSGVFIMRSTTALALSLMTNALGQSEFAGITMNGGTLSGLPAIVSEFVPEGYVVLANASDIYLADDGEVAVDMSNQASLEMANNPEHDSTTPTGATGLVSLWQTNSVAFRGERIVNWARRRPSAVAVLSGVAWGVPAAPGGGE